MNVVLLGESFYVEVVKSLINRNLRANIIAEITSLNEVQKIAVKTKNITVVCCLLGDHEKQDFFEAMRYCYENHLSFLHPAFILRDVEFPLPMTPKIRTYGFPGSGNMLLGDFIHSHIPFPKRTEVENIYCMIGSHYYHMLHCSIEEAFQASIQLTFSPGSSITYSATEEYRGILRAYQDNNRQFVIHNFPCLAFSWDSNLSCHGFLSKRTIDFYEKKEFSQVLIVRDPLDTIFSNLNKLRSIGEKYNYENIDIFSKYYTEFMRVALKNRHKVYIIRYEDILNDTVNVLTNLSEYCKLNVTHSDIIKWQNKKLFKTLPRADLTHFQGGGAGKWKDSFDKRCFDIFKKNGILSIVDKLGYPMPNLAGYSKKVANYQNYSTDVARNHLALYYHPYWRINEAYECLKTPYKRNIYYKFYNDVLDMQKNFESNSLPLQLMVDAFYKESTRTSILHTIKSVWGRFLPYCN